MGEADIERLLQDSGIVRHRGKIASTINNAQAHTRDPEASSAPSPPISGRSSRRRPTAPGRRRHAAAADGRLARAEQGSAQARLQLRRSDHGATPSCRRWGWSTTTSSHCYCRAECEAERKALKRPAGSADGSAIAHGASGGRSSSISSASRRERGSASSRLELRGDAAARDGRGWRAGGRIVAWHGMVGPAVGRPPRDDRK